MYFYVDESGHTGPNLFDEQQPTLFYGLLSSNLNLDAVLQEAVIRMRRNLNVARLHASEIRGVGLARIAGDLYQLQRRYPFQFDCFQVQKADHAVIAFFDQVFDCHMNPAVAWHQYWTPMRYVLLLDLAQLFDEPVARDVWAARITQNDKQAAKLISDACTTLLTRLPHIKDARVREVLGQALTWASENPEELMYNVSDAASAKAIMPNVIGFQSVMFRIAQRLRATETRRAFITVDRQSQFNTAQRSLAEVYARARGNVVPMGPGMPVVDWRGMPAVPIRISGGDESPGLEVTDCLLWIFKRVLVGEEIPEELHPLVGRLVRRSRTDEVSLDAISKRWARWFAELPDPTEDQIEGAKELLQVAEERRQRALEEAKPSDET